MRNIISDLPDKSIVIMDNTAFHKSNKTQKMPIKNNGHIIEFSPPYSHGFHLIEPKRWIQILGFSIQPSEFLKPFYTCF